MSDTIEIAFEGTPIAARAGESVAAALAAHGILSLRTTRDAAERGMFCGMGVCQDCLVEIDGTAGTARLHDQGRSAVAGAPPGAWAGARAGR